MGLFGEPIQMNLRSKCVSVFLTLTVMFTVCSSVCRGADPPTDLYRQAGNEYSIAAQAMNSGDFTRAEELSNHALEILEKYDSDVKIALNILLADIKINRRQPQVAQPYADKALELARRISGNRSPLYSLALYKKGHCLTEQHLYSVSLGSLVPAAEIQQELVKKKALASSEYISTLKLLAFAFAGADKEEQAKKAMSNLLSALGKPKVTEFDINMYVASAYSQIGLSYYASSKLTAAQGVLEKARTIYYRYYDKAGDGYVGAKTLHTPLPAVIDGMRTLGLIYKKQGKGAEGDKLVSEADQWAKLRASTLPKN